jgi:hypothetical protein
MHKPAGKTLGRQPHDDGEPGGAVWSREGDGAAPRSSWLVQDFGPAHSPGADHNEKEDHLGNNGVQHGDHFERSPKHATMFALKSPMSSMKKVDTHAVIAAIVEDDVAAKAAAGGREGNDNGAAERTKSGGPSIERTKSGGPKIPARGVEREEHDDGDEFNQRPDGSWPHSRWIHRTQKSPDGKGPREHFFD